MRRKTNSLLSSKRVWSKQLQLQGLRREISTSLLVVPILLPRRELRNVLLRHVLFESSWVWKTFLLFSPFSPSLHPMLTKHLLPSSLFSQKPKISQKHSVNDPHTQHRHIPSPASSEADLFSWHISCEWHPKSISRVKRERGSIMIFGGMMLRLRLLFCSLSLLRLSRMYVSRIDAPLFFFWRFFFWKKRGKECFLGAKGNADWRFFVSCYFCCASDPIRNWKRCLDFDSWEYRKSFKGEWVSKEEEEVSTLSLPLFLFSLTDRWTQQMYYVDEILYMLVMPIIKIAILCTYLRIFTNIKFKRLVYGTIGLNVAYAIAFSLITIFQCTPVKNVCLTLPTPRDTDLIHSFIYSCCY